MALISPQMYYDILDDLLTDLVEEAEVEITPKIDQLLVRINETLRAALGLPNQRH